MLTDEQINAIAAQADAHAKGILATLDRAGGTTPAPSTFGHVLDFLSVFDKPRNALATGVSDALSNDPGKSFLGGLGEGWQQKRQTSWGDVVGIDETKPTDDWLSWLAKGGGRLALDIAADPLNLLFAPAKAAGLFPRLAKAAAPLTGAREGQSIAGKVGEKLGSGAVKDWLSASNVTGPVMHRLPQVTRGGVDYGQVESGIDKWFRDGSLAPLQKQALEINEKFKQALKDNPSITKEDIFEALERPGQYPQLEPIAETIRPLQEAMNANFEKLNAKREAMGLEKMPTFDYEGYAYMPHRLTEQARIDMIKKGLGDPDMRSSARDILNYVDEQGNVLATGRVKDPRTRVKMDADGNYWHTDPETKVKTQVFPDAASLREVRSVTDMPSIASHRWVDEAGQVIATGEKNPRISQAADGSFVYTDPVTGRNIPVTGKPVTGRTMNTADLTPEELARGAKEGYKTFVTDPVAAAYESAARRQNQYNFLNILDEGLANGSIVSSLNQPAGKRGLRGLESIDPKLPPDMSRPSFEVLEGMRQLNIPGLEGYWARPAVANRYEALAKKMFDPTTPVGAGAEALDKFFRNTNLGRAFVDLTGAWKSLVLAHPGWLAGNVGSNLVQQWLGGISPTKIPYRMYEGAKLQAGKGADVIPGISNASLMEEFGKRGIGGLEQQPRQIEEMLGMATSPMSRLENWFGPKVGGALESWRQTAAKYTTDPIFTAGTAAENNAKLSVAIDALKKELKAAGGDFNLLTKEEQASMLDRVARKGQEALIDYYGIGGLSPTEATIAKGVVPFLGWQRGIMGRTAEVAATEPYKLNRLGMFLDATNQPLSPQDKAIADAWVREAAPVTKAFGYDLGASPEGLPQMLTLGRFLPHGNVEQATKRPADFLASTLNPFLKAPIELIMNRNTFKDRPMDEVAGGFPSNVINPLIGQPYSLASQTTMGAHLPAAWDYLIRQAPGGRHLNEMSEFGRSAGLWNDPYKAQMSFGDYLKWYLTGGKLYPFDQARYMKNRQTEATKAERTLKGNMNYALKRGDMVGAEFYSDQLLRHQMNRASIGVEAP